MGADNNHTIAMVELLVGGAEVNAETDFGKWSKFVLLMEHSMHNLIPVYPTAIHVCVGIVFTPGRWVDYSLCLEIYD